MHLKCVLKSSVDLPVSGNMHTNCNLETVKLTLCLTNNLFKKMFDAKVDEVLRVAIAFED